MPYKFEKLEVWQLALAYTDTIYRIAEQLPRSEDFNLKSQITRAATSIALNIAEGSTSQSDAEQARFLGFAIRSLIETAACIRLIEQRSYLEDQTLPMLANQQNEILFAKIQSFRISLKPRSVQEKSAKYRVKIDRYPLPSNSGNLSNF